MRPLDSSPDSWGAHKASVFPHPGPASYDQLDVTSPAALPASGGDVVQAVEAGMKYFDIVLGSFSDTGKYFVRSIPVAPSDATNGGQQTTYRLAWYVTATGAEAANAADLSDEVVRLLGIGPK